MTRFDHRSRAPAACGACSAKQARAHRPAPRAPNGRRGPNFYPSTAVCC